MSPAASAAALPYPPYMAHLVDRAAQLLKARWPAACVDFTWWHAEEDWHYIARLEWPWESELPRVIVCSRHGEFVCQSLPGKLWTIDPSLCNGDSHGHDELDRFEWELQHGKRADSASGAK